MLLLVPQGTCCIESQEIAVNPSHGARTHDVRQSVTTTEPPSISREEFIQFYSDTQPWLLFRARQLCSYDEALAEDLSQEVYLRIYSGLHTLEFLSPPLAGLNLTRAAIDAFRKEGRQRRLITRLETLAPSFADDPAQHVTDRVQVRELLAVLDDTPRQKETFFLAEAGKFTAAEIGDLLGLERVPWIMGRGLGARSGSRRRRRCRGR